MYQNHLFWSYKHAYAAIETHSFIFCTRYKINWGGRTLWTPCITSKVYYLLLHFNRHKKSCNIKTTKLFKFSNNTVLTPNTTLSIIKTELSNFKWYFIEIIQFLKSKDISK